MRYADVGATADSLMGIVCVCGPWCFKQQTLNALVHLAQMQLHASAPFDCCPH